MSLYAPISLPTPHIPKQIFYLFPVRVYSLVVYNTHNWCMDQIQCCLNLVTKEEQWFQCDFSKKKKKKHLTQLDYKISINLWLRKIFQMVKNTKENKNHAVSHGKFQILAQAPGVHPPRQYLSFERGLGLLLSTWGVPKRGSPKRAWAIFLQYCH